MRSFSAALCFLAVGCGAAAVGRAGPSDAVMNEDPLVNAAPKTEWEPAPDPLAGCCARLVQPSRTPSTSLWATVLERLGEPTLEAAASHHVDAIRLTWVRPCRPAVVIRVTKSSSGWATLAREVPPPNRPEYSFIREVQRSDGVLTEAATKTLQAALENADFWKASERDTACVNTNPELTGEMVIEGSWGGRYRKLQRQGSQDLAQLAALLVRMGALAYAPLPDEAPSSGCSR